MLRITCIIPTTASNSVLLHLKKNLDALGKPAKTEIELTVSIVSSNPNAPLQLLNNSIQNFYLVSTSLGFAQMNNIAIEESMRFYKSDYYLFINDDAWISKDFMSELIKLTEKQLPDVIVPLVYKPDGKTIDTFGIEYFRSGYATDVNSFETNSTLVCAACFLVRTSFLKKMNKLYGFYFNPLLHSFIEDIEFSIRILAAGGNISKFSQLVAYHHRSTSYISQSATVQYYSCRNLLWVIFLTWPINYIYKYIHKILLFQSWVIVSWTRWQAPFIVARIFIDSLFTFHQLRASRQKILSAYRKNSDFDRIFSPYSFRTRKKNMYIK